MRARRELIRAVVPPLLALGLVALLVRPVDPMPPVTVAPGSVSQSTAVAPSAP
jgi:hypothetical protein